MDTHRKNGMTRLSATPNQAVSAAAAMNTSKAKAAHSVPESGGRASRAKAYAGNREARVPSTTPRTGLRSFHGKAGPPGRMRQAKPMQASTQARANHAAPNG